MTFATIDFPFEFLKPETLGSKLQYFKFAGYDADFEACCKAYKKMLEYRTWLEESSRFAKKEYWLPSNAIGIKLQAIVALF